jgi:hypothetical protein
VQDRPKDALAELKQAVEARAELFAQSQKLRGRGYVASDDVDYTLALLLRSQVRVAVLEQNPDRARQQLRDLVAALDRFGQRITADHYPDPDSREAWTLGVKQAIAFDRYRLTLVDVELGLVLDDPFVELEWLLWHSRGAAVN